MRDARVLQYYQKPAGASAAAIGIAEEAGLDMPRREASAARKAPKPPDARKVTELLLRRYPNPRTALRFSTPLELLVATILSAQCTDARVNEVTKTLFQKYRRAADYANADQATFQQEIRSTGFYRNKAKTVIACAKKLVGDFGGEVPDKLEQLVTLPGVGRKTANVVLGNAFGRQAIAVDTHVMRVANRLGLVRSEDADEIEMALV